MHIRCVEWLKTVPRSIFPKDILFSMNSALTVFSVYRNEAENRVNDILAFDSLVPEAAAQSAGVEIEGVEDEEAVDLAATARDEIIKFIEAEFKGHGLANLVAAILRGPGIKTRVSPPGPDGGVDILAGSGPLGFDQPRLCVQVKSGRGTQSQNTFNELLGVMSKYVCEQGLLVSWGGFTNPVKADAQKHFFKVRLWDQGHVVDAILESYERLDAEIRAELPLKKIFVMVNDEAE